MKNLFVGQGNSQNLQKLDSQYTRAGACLQGARLKEGLSQVNLAKKIGIAQTNVSAMELGKRPIGKSMAKRLAKVLKVDYTPNERKNYN